MDYEKAYKAALEWMRDVYPTLTGAAKEDAEHFFPELAESEDEKIRKEIKQFILDNIGEISIDDKENAWLVWLEKKKRQKQSEMEKEYVRTLHSLIADFLRGKQEIDREYYQKIWDWLDNRHIEQKDIKLLSWRAVDECKDIPDGHYVVVAYNRPGFFRLDTVINGKLSHPNYGDIKATGVFYIPNAEENCMCIIEKQKPDYCHHEVDLSECSEEYSKGYYDGWNNCNQQYSQLEAEQKPDIKICPHSIKSKSYSEQKPATFSEPYNPDDYEVVLEGNATSLRRKEQKPIEWSDSFEENIRILLHDKLTWHSEDGKTSSTVFIDDKTVKDIISGIWFYVGKEAIKYPNKELKTAEWSEEDEAKLEDVLYWFEIFCYKNQSKPEMRESLNWLKSLPMGCPKKTE